MKHTTCTLLLCLSFATIYTACISNNNTKTNNPSNTNYQHLSKDKSIKNYVGQQIWLEGTEAKMAYQHMMKSSPLSLEGTSEEKHLYVDYNEGKQVVAYYRGITIPKDQKDHKFYGTVQSMSGAGKGGGTHTEYYLDLDKIE